MMVLVVETSVAAGDSSSFVVAATALLLEETKLAPDRRSTLLFEKQAKPMSKQVRVTPSIANQSRKQTSYTF
jgi:hypothetical protein